MISLAERSSYYKQVQMEYWQAMPSASVPELYRDLLLRHFSNPAPGLLGKAEEIGRRAMDEGTGLLDLLEIHENALSDLVESGQFQGDPLGSIRAGSRILESAMSPYETARLGCQETISSLRQLYECLDERARQTTHSLRAETSQLLTVIQQELADMSQNAPDSAAGRINLVVSLLDDVREQLHEASHELRPLILEQLGLLPALRFLALGIRKRSGIEVLVHGEVVERFSTSMEGMLYRIVQEALENVVRHAHATLAEVRVWLHQGVVYCVVSDNGIGFEVPDQAAGTSSGTGLPGIDERVESMGGTCRVVAMPGQGAQLKVAIPL